MLYTLLLLLYFDGSQQKAESQNVFAYLILVFRFDLTFYSFNQYKYANMLLGMKSRNEQKKMTFVLWENPQRSKYMLRIFRICIFVQYLFGMVLS